MRRYQRKAALPPMLAATRSPTAKAGVIPNSAARPEISMSMRRFYGLRAPAAKGLSIWGKVARHPPQGSRSVSRLEVSSLAPPRAWTAA